jgi:DNA-binding NtrC family response regulator
MTPSRLQATILLVADQIDVRAALAEVLRLQGYQVLTAASVPETEAIGQRFGLEYLSLVIIDLRPIHDRWGREGYDLVQRWGIQAPHLPFILISCNLLPDKLDPPVVWWLAKPLAPEILLAAVRDTLRH